MLWSRTMRLDRIQIEGFKSIREVDLQLDSLNVLIGANGAGKSNFIGALSLLSEVVDSRLQLSVAKAGGASAMLHHGAKRTPELRIKITSGQNEYDARLAYARPDRLIFSSETALGVPRGSSRPFEVSMGAGHEETRLHEEAKTGAIARWVLRRIQSWRLYHFQDTSEAAPVKRKGKIDDNASLRHDAANLAAFLYRLKKQDLSKSYQRIVAAVRQVAPFFDDFILRPDPLSKDPSIQLEWSERDSDAYFNAHSLSDGTLRYICLATLLLQPLPPSLILIDEPEIGLHPYAITQLAGLLEHAATRTQVLVATQSATLINQFGPEEVIVVDRVDGQSTFRRLAEEDIISWAEEYALGELWEKNVFGGRPQAM